MNAIPVAHSSDETIVVPHNSSGQIDPYEFPFQAELAKKLRILFNHLSNFLRTPKPLKLNQMNAIQIAYSPDETIVALGHKQGRIDLHEVSKKSKGKPEKSICTINRHEEAIVHLRITSDGHVISVDEDGKWAYHSISGELVRKGKSKMSCVLAHSDVKGKVIYMGSVTDDGVELVKIDISSGNKVHAPKEATHGIEPEFVDWGCRPIALDENRAAFYIQLATQQLIIVDFEKQTFETIPLKYRQLTPENLVSDPIIDISTTLDIGVRLDYHPLQKNEDGDYQLSAEVFRLSTGERQYSIPCDAIPKDHVDPVLIDGDQGSEEYREVRDNFAKRLTNIRIEENGKRVWLSAIFHKPGVLCFDLEGKKHVGMVFSGNEPEPKTFNLDNAFELDQTFKVLGVSPSGSYIGFGLPNNWANPDFGDTFKVIELESDQKRSKNGGKQPQHMKKAFLVSDEWAVVNSGSECFLIDIHTGETLKHFRTEYLTIKNGALSPDKKHIALGCEGECGFLWNLESGEVSELYYLTIGGPVLGWLDDKRVVFTSGQGGIIEVDIKLFKEEGYEDSGHYGLKLDGDDELEDHEIMEMQVDASTSDMFSLEDKSMVLEILGYIGGGVGEKFWFNKYVFKGSKIKTGSIKAKWDGSYEPVDLMACGNKAIVKGEKNVFVYEAKTGERLNHFVLDKKQDQVFVNMEKNKAYIYTDMSSLCELDVENSNRKTILDMPRVKGFSITKNILLAQKEDHTIEVMDVGSGKSLVKAAVVKGKENSLVVEKIG